jgi:hypothetical protein
MKNAIRTRLTLAVLVIALAGLAGCGGGNDDPDCDSDDPCATASPAVSPTPTPIATATVIPTASSSVTPARTASPSPNPTASQAPTPTLTSTTTPAPTPTPTLIATATQMPTPSHGATRTATPGATPTLAPNACLPSSSLGILVQGTDATVYAPLGNWHGGNGSGVKVVPIETKSGFGTGGEPVTVATKNVVNSCSCNSTTGQTVCVANNTDVYLITGTTLKSTLTSGATSSQSFSGGGCENCGVVVDSSINKALITVGLATGGPGGFQFLDLGGATPTFETPIPASKPGPFRPDGTSEDVSIDPNRHLVLSPNEANNYQLLNISAGTDKAALFNNRDNALPLPFGEEFDSAAEDCTTGIALSTIEGSGDLFIADLTQAKFTPGSPGAWTDTASQIQHFPEFRTLFPDGRFKMGLFNGTSGIAVAPGTRFAVVTGEDCSFTGAVCNIEGVIELPSTSGTGTPSVVDWVAFTVPDDPSGTAWAEGGDPHTVTAYVSPNSKKAFGVLGNHSFTFLAVIDLEGLLKAPRTGGHTVTNPLPAALVTFIAE